MIKFLYNHPLDWWAGFTIGVVFFCLILFCLFWALGEIIIDLPRNKQNDRTLWIANEIQKMSQEDQQFLQNILYKILKSREGG